MSAPSTDFSFSLLPATVEDGPAIVMLAVRAQSKDRNTLVKYGGEGYTERLKAMFSEGSSDLFDDPRSLPMKAVDDATGEIIGTACWGFRGYPELDAKKAEMDKEKAKLAAKADAAPGNNDKPMLETTLKGKELNDLTSAHITEVHRVHILPSGGKTIIFMGLNVLPEYQRKGVGSALAKFGTDRMDKDGVKSWTHSSEAGYPAYAKAGFQVVETLTVDLDKYASGPMIDEAGHEQKWGTYTFRYLERTPSRQ